MTKDDMGIILALADCDMNVTKLGRRLYMHRNTVEYHLNKVKRETGLNPKKFHDLTKLLRIIDESLKIRKS